jgi:hypothetical protein
MVLLSMEDLQQKQLKLVKKTKIMKKQILLLIFFIALKTSVYSQNYNGTYKDNINGITLKISNYNKTKGSITFELIVNEHPCFGSRKEIANCCDYDNSPSNEFIFRTEQEDGEYLYITFNKNGNVVLKSDENGFNIQGMCGIWKDEVIFKRVNIPKKQIKKS